MIRDKLNLYTRKIFNWAGHPAYRIFVSVLAAADVFFWIIPTDALLVSAVVADPLRWRRSAVMITTGSAVGALLMVIVIRWIGWEPPYTYPVLEYCNVYVLALAAGGPFPLQPAAIAAGFSDLNEGTVFFSIWFGRLAKYLLFAWLATRIRYPLSGEFKIRDLFKRKVENPD